LEDWKAIKKRSLIGIWTLLTNLNANAAILAQADQTNGAGWFNGDDAIALRKGGASGTIVDAIGQIGVDPGTEWGSGLTSTADNTLGGATAGVTITQSGGSTDINEQGETSNTYTIALNTAPTETVSIAIAADEETQISKDGVNFFNSVTLDLNNTNPQTITVRAVNDLDAEGSPHTSAYKGNQPHHHQ